MPSHKVYNDYISSSDFVFYEIGSRIYLNTYKKSIKLILDAFLVLNII